MAERYRREQDRNPGVAVLECRDCGALVVDVEAHDRFHDALTGQGARRHEPLLSADAIYARIDARVAEIVRPWREGNA